MKKIIWVICLSLGVLFLRINVAMGFEGFYTLGEQNIEFRLAKQVSDFSSYKDWQIKKDVKGNKYFVSNEVCINEDDVEGILIEKLKEEEKSATFIINGKAVKIMNYCEDNPYKVSIYFKKNSWKKIWDLTQRSHIDNIAIVRKKKIILCPTVRDRFVKDVSISMVDKKSMRLLLEGLPRGEKPSLEQREIDYENWLIMNIENDIDYARKLETIAHKYYSERKDYQRAIMLYELILSKYPEVTDDNYFALGLCYFEEKNYDKAISVFEIGISVEPDIQSQIIMEMAIGDCYAAKEQYSIAIDKYRSIFEKVKNNDLPDKDALINMINLRIKYYEGKPNSPTNGS